MINTEVMSIRLIINELTACFFRTEDVVEYSVRKKNGDLIVYCYSESDRMGK